MRVADFFCGGGGFSEGFRQAGFEIVFAVDKWLPAVTTYQGNKPGVNVIQDDVIRISQLPDKEFERIVPDSEVIIGSPPCQAFSHSNKSGNADKTLGIELINAYLRIIARKKYKEESILRFWVLENVPGVKEYIKEEYTAADLGLTGDFVLRPHDGASGVYNAKYFGAPTNRKRYLCGEFPRPLETNTDETVITMRQLLESLGDPLGKEPTVVIDVNYPDFMLPRNQVSDHQYVHELAPFEWKTAKRLKQDKGYMGKMSFPENLDRPARTVMATMSSSSREAMILGYGSGRYRLPTVREAASMMSFPIDYRFYGASRGIKHTLVGNAVPPKMSYAIAKAMAQAENIPVPDHYLPIHHDTNIPFLNLNGMECAMNSERPRREVAKFKYHIPYLIINSYRVELTNYHSDFEKKSFQWTAEIHYSQGKKKADFFTPEVTNQIIGEQYRTAINEFLAQQPIVTFDEFQRAFCMTESDRQKSNTIGPYELLERIREFIDAHLDNHEKNLQVQISESPHKLPLAILIGYYVLRQIIHRMEEL